ncbi:MAG: glycosyltransferase, partial [Oscillospiraceae bacterium]|nr:glycosyltransferase [Oscillospiraceae bacterium]
AAYMDHCIQTLLSAGPEAEIILVDDGSTDNTPAQADDWAARYPDIIRVIHQPNGGHGEGVNQGIRNASGLYYKVVDSDDWLDEVCLKTVMDRIRGFVAGGTLVDMFVCNYVYEHVEDNTSRSINYRSAFPVEKIITWKDMGYFNPTQNLLMHSVIYRTQILRDCGLVLPKHTFYVDNIFVYQPLPYVKTIYYMDLDLYRYFIGRSDQSVNEAVMVKRVDQQLRVTRLMMDKPDLNALTPDQAKLARYMKHYLAVMMCISSVFCLLAGTPEAKAKKDALWADLRRRDEKLYRKFRYFYYSALTNLPGALGEKITIGAYRLAQKVVKFN